MIKFLGKYWFWIIAIIMLTAMILILFGAQLKAMFTKKDDPNVMKDSPGAADASAARGFPLKKGSSGANVTSLQKFLNAADSSYKLIVDGSFGTNTENAVSSEITGIPGIDNPKQVPEWYFDQNIKGKF